MAKKGNITSEKFITPVFRVSFPNLTSPRKGKFKDGEGAAKYGLSAVWDPENFKSDYDRKQWKKMKKHLDDVADRAFGVKFDKLGSGKFRNHKTGLRDGEEKDGLEGYGPGTFFASMTTQSPPGVTRKEDGEWVKIDSDEIDELIYPGCYARAKVNLFSYDNEGKGIGFSLTSVQFVADGPRLDSRTDPTEDFDEIEDDWDEGYGDDDSSSKKKKKSKKSRDEDDEDEDEDEDDRKSKKSKKSKKSRDEDEDEDEDDDLPPRKSKKSRYKDDEDEDEDEDDRKSKKSKKSKKSRYEDDDEDDED